MTYEYQCPKCNKVYEVSRMMKDRNDEYFCADCANELCDRYYEAHAHYWMNCEWPGGHNDN